MIPSRVGPLGSRFSEDRTGQSEMIGVVLIFGLVIIGTAGIIVLGSASISDTQSATDTLHAEHGLTQMDSKVAEVALGDATVKSVTLGRSQGTYTVNQSAGSMTITHVNYDGNGNDEQVYTGSLGAIEFETDDTTIAYQGGGVWRQSGTGSTMVSQPEIHFRSGTLTLPLIRVQGDDRASGTVSAIVRSSGPVSHVYPNGPNAPYDATNAEYENPQTEGRFQITIQSAYYQGWADYFRARTGGDVIVDHDTNSVTLELISPGTTGTFEMPGEGGSIDIHGTEDHSVTNFTITLVDDQNDNANMANLDWSMWAEKDDQQFELHFRQASGGSCSDLQVNAVVYYSPADGDSDTDDPYHGWTSQHPLSTSCQDVDGDTEDETVLEVVIIDDEDGDGDVAEIEAGDTMLTYSALSSKDTTHFGNPGSNRLIEASGDTPTYQFDGHPVSWEAKGYDADSADATVPSEESMDRVINHYFSELGPSFELAVDDHNSNTIDESLASGNITYPADGRYITYLHVTENTVTIDIETSP